MQEAGSQRIETRDAQAVVAALSRVLAPHEMDLSQCGRAIRATVRHARFASCGLADLTYGAAVRIRSRVPAGRVLVHAVAEGQSRIVLGQGRTMELRAGDWHVSAPAAPLDIAFGSTSRHFTANLPVELWPDGLRSPDPVLAERTQGGRVWIDLMRFALGWAELGSGAAGASGEHVVALMQGVLRDHAQAARLPDGSGPTPWFVRDACAIIANRVQAGAETITLPDVAARVGVGTRTLQGGLRRFTGRTFGEVVRDERLDALHRLIGEGQGRDDVTTLMHACGIVSTGRYAGYYRDRFGTTPSARLRLSH